MSDDHFMTTEDVMDYLHVNLRTVYRLLKRGLPGFRVGRQWRFRKTTIDQWLESNRRDSQTNDPLERTRILVVDDEPPVRELLVRTLVDADYDVDAAPDGPTAVEFLRDHDYDLLITDLKMPGMDGLSVIREARRKSTDMPIIVLTGYSTEASAIEAINLGVTGYLTKPFRMQRVLQVAARALGESAATGAAARCSRRFSAAVIQLSNLTKSFGERVLLDAVTWTVGDGDRVGLCGPNGAGKTTLLRILAGIDEPDGGRVVTPAALTVGYLPQDGLEHSGRNLLDEASLAFGSLLEARAEIDRIEHALADAGLPDGEHERLLVRYHDLTEMYRREEGHSIELRVTQVLEGLGFSKSDFGKPAETFSGGWQMRIALAKLLLGRPTLLLLDEPTNHLDLEARNWLEAYLHEYPHAVILVSHDRFFLDAVVTRIAEISLRTITDYVGNYSKYLVERDASLERLRKAKQDQDDEVARMRAFIDRFRYQATKAAQVQSRIKMLDKIVPIEVPPERRRVHFTFPACPKSGRTVLDLSDVHKAYGDLVVFNGINLHVERGDRIALVAPNGAGKSTLMRMLSGAEAPDRGVQREGHQVVMQYFAQDEANRLPPTKSVYEVMEADSPIGMVPAIRNILGGFLFSGDDIYKRAGVLSGGERTRLAVARMLLRPANTLLLDEPTNHLDLDSKDVLLEALEDFGGTLIFVSHDRYFVDRLANKIIVVGHQSIETYPGTYEQFLWSREERRRPAPAPVEKPTAPTKQKYSSPPPVAIPGGGRPAADAGKRIPTPTYEEKKRADADARRRRRDSEQRERRISDLETLIAEKERTIKELEAQMAGDGFYDDRSVAESVVSRHQALMWEVGDLMHQWETLQSADLAE